MPCNRQSANQLNGSKTIYESLLIEKIDEFKNSFTNTSRKIFSDEQKKLIHPGEFGIYRETLTKNLIRFFVPKRLDIGSGFVINNSNEISHQCDIVIFDSINTPLNHGYVSHKNNSNNHFKLFCTYLFQTTSSCTILYPEIIDYISLDDIS